MGFNSLIMLLAVVLVLLLSDMNYCGAEGRKSLSKEDDLELERQLKILNKPPIKTFVTKYGDVFDCIDIRKQPAFDHPLLKNHKIEMNPKFTTDKTINNIPSSIKKASKIENDKSKDETCPTGSVPIRRTKKQDIVTAKYFSEQKNDPPSILHYLSVKPTPPDGKTGTYHGGSAHSSNTWDPNNLPKGYQFVTSQMWLQGGPAGDVDSIEFGWAIWPELFGDGYARVFGYYTNTGYRTGCFNTVCLGFMQIHPRISMGTITADAHMYMDSDASQYVWDIKIEPSDGGNWWFSIGSDKIGYWPGALFQYMSHRNASAVRYGAKLGHAVNEANPPLGIVKSLSYLDIMNACYISRMKIRDLSLGFIDFDSHHVALEQDESSKNRYKLEFHGNLTGRAGQPMGIGMVFGGPGGTRAC